MSPAEFWIILVTPITTVILTLVFAWIWIAPTAEGNVDGIWGNRMNAHKYSGLRLRAYDRAHRKNYRESRRRNA